MKLTIIPSDGAVYVNNISYSGLVFSHPSGIHALQWDGEKGWIEFVNETEFRRPPNETITELPEWALQAKEKWDEKHTIELAAIEERNAQIAALENK